MSKRVPKRINSLEEVIRQEAHLSVQNDPPPAPRPLPLSLDDIRAQALRERSNAAHTIADLEAWRSEIDATIAFLKGPR